MRRMLSAAVALCAAAFLWVCATGTAYADTVVVDADDSAGSVWRPAQVTVKAGDTVQWQFDEATLPHNVKSSSANWSYTTPIATKQPPVEFTFDEPGVYTYLCEVHATTMTGSVTVEDDTSNGLENVLVFSKTSAITFRHSSIDEGIAAIEALGAANGYNVDATEDGAQFTDANLAQYDAVVFLSTTGDILTPEQQTAFENYIRNGGGFVGVHAASDTEYTWPWYGRLVGAYFRNHPDGTPTASVDVEDPDHPSTADVPARWTRTDEWYNFQTFNKPVAGGNQPSIRDYSPRGSDVHVLATLDESTLAENDGNTTDDDHPIAWCSNFDGGRSWYTGMGHTEASFAEADFLEHLQGGIEWAGGATAGDCGGARQAPPTADDFEQVTVDDDTESPMELAVADDGRVFYVERITGEINVWNPATGVVSTAIQLPVSSVQENGLMGIQLAPDFNTSGHLYVTYTPLPNTNNVTRLSRFTYANNAIAAASEQVIFTWEAQREQCCHSSGTLAFAPNGDLYIGTGDNTNPFGDPPSGFAPIDERTGRGFWDAQRTSANSNNLNGKVLRIRPIPGATGVPGVGTTYTIPDGNMFAPGTANTRPEIYAMGFRNPFRLTVDPITGWVLLGDYGPDAGATNPNRGPQGSVEYNVVKQPGFYGWPYCVRDNVPYNDFNYATETSGAKFDCNAPTNTSPNNTGITNLPPAIPATMWMGYTETDARHPNLGTGGAPTGGPRYQFDPDLNSPSKFPEYYDGHWFIGEWNNGWIKTATLDDDGNATNVFDTPWLDTFARPHEIEFGPDGALYVIDWGSGFNGNNTDSGIYRIDYIAGERRPVAIATSDKDNGPTPLTVNFSSAGSSDPEGTSLTYEWDFDGDGDTDSTDPNPTHTYTTAGSFNALLTVTDQSGAEGFDTIPITAGNTRPTVTIEIPEDGQFHAFGDRVPYEITVTDPENQVDCDDVVLSVQLGHDDHAHGLGQQTGCEGIVQTRTDSGHGANANIFTSLVASYTDEAQGAAGALTGLDDVVLHPKPKQAEYFDSTGRIAGAPAGGDPGVGTETTTDAGGGTNIGFIEHGDYVGFERMSLKDLTGLRFRVASGGAGGTIQVRLDAPDGELVGEAAVTPTGGWQSWANVQLALSDPPEGTHDLFLVFVNPSANPGDGLLNVNHFTALGKGAAISASPDVTATADPDGGEAPLEVQFTGTATDPDAEPGETLTYAWDFGVAGTSDDTSTELSPTYTYERPGTYLARFTATDPNGQAATASVEVEVTAPPSECPQDNVRSDEFDGDSLDTNRWSIIRPDDTRPPTVEGGALNFPIDVGSIYGPGTSARNIIVQPLPDGNVEVTAKISTEPLTENFQQAGLRVYAGDQNWASVHMIHAGGSRDFEFIYENNNVPRNEGADKLGGIPADSPHDYWVKLISDGSTLTAQYSWDGQTWNDVGRPADISGWVDPQVGPTALSDNAATFPVASFDWIRFNPDGTGGGGGGGGGDDIVDGFDGTQLDGAWDVLRQNQTLNVAGGTLNIPAETGDIYGAGGNAKNLVMRPAPAGPWTATTKVNFQGTMQYHQAGLMVFGDDDNFTKFGRLTTNASGSTLAQKFEFIYENNATPRNEAADSTANLPTLPADYWLRITSDGTNITGAYSLDGSAWTPVGRPAPLPADAKIGLFSFANAGTGNPVAAFDEFVLDLPGGGPSGPSFDDDFDGSTLDKNRWNAIVRDTPAEYAVQGGHLNLTLSPGDIYTGDTNPPPNNFILQDAAHAGSDWVIETKISETTVDGGYAQGGLLAYADGQNYVKFDALSDPNNPRVNRLELRSEVNGVIQNPQVDQPVTAAQAAGPIWLRLSKTGTNYSGEFSFDGTTWTAFPGGAVPNAMASPDFGLFGFAPQAIGVGDLVAFDYFTLDGRDSGEPCECVAGPGQGDEFDGDSLSTARWNAIAQDDPTKYRVAGGGLEVTTTAGQIYQGESGGGPLILQSGDDLPADWTLETKFANTLGGGWSQGGLLAYVGANDYVKLNAISDDGQSRVNRLELRSEVGGVIGPAGSDPTIPATATDIWLRLTKAGSTYSAEYSLDGSTWTAFAYTVTNAMASPDAGLYTHGVLRSGDTVTFDYMKVNGTTGCEEEPENAPPVIESVTADPATGFAPHEVDFDVTATDADEGDELSYSWDFGDGGTSDEEDPTHTYTEAGEYEAQVTVSDGTVERTRTVPVSVLEPDDAEARFRVLVFSKTAGFRHDSIDEGHAAIEALGEDHGFQVDHTEDAGAFRDDVLDHYDSVVWLSTTGDVLNADQQSAFERFIQDEGGYTGIHAAADTEYEWKWYGSLVGAYFKSHPPGTPPASVDVEDTDHHSTEGLPARWDRVDEWYNYRAVNFEETNSADYSPRGDVHVLATLDESTLVEDDGNETDDDHPISWCQRYDGGRSWYTGMGHTAASFSEELYLQHILGGIEVSAGAVEDAECGVDGGGPGAPVVEAFADPSSGPAPLRVQFSANADDPDGGRVTLHWDFGDGGDSFAARPRHTYTTPGTYTATLTATDDEGDITTDEIEIVVAAPAVEAIADPSTAPVGTIVRFRAEGTHGQNATYEWDFGDGATSFERHPRHAYDEPGTFEAEVTVTMASGATSSDTVTVTVTNAAPTVQVGASPRSGSAPLRVNFTAVGADADGRPNTLTYAWQFGDGGTANTRNASHTYTRTGTYTARVTVTDAHGATGTATVQIQVGTGTGANRAPTVRAAADPATGTAPVNIRFSSAGSDPDGDRLTYTWNFGDGGQAAGASATHRYTAAGTYTATVTVRDPGGLTGTATVTVTVGARGAQGGVQGETASSALVKLNRTWNVRKLMSKGLRYRVSCKAACRVTSKLRLGKRTIGKASAKRIKAGKTRTIVVRLNKRLRGSFLDAMRKADVRRVRASVVTKVSSGGRSTTISRRVTLKR